MDARAESIERPSSSQAEIERLRARVASLEAELVEMQARTNAVVAQCAGARLLARPLAPRPERPDAPPRRRASSAPRCGQCDRSGARCKRLKRGA